MWSEKTTQDISRHIHIHTVCFKTKSTPPKNKRKAGVPTMLKMLFYLSLYMPDIIGYWANILPQLSVVITRDLYPMLSCKLWPISGDEWSLCLHLFAATENTCLGTVFFILCLKKFVLHRMHKWQNCCLFISSNSKRVKSLSYQAVQEHKMERDFYVYEFLT